MTLILVGFVFIWGVMSYMAMPRESEPEVVVPIGMVSVVFPGASSFDVEELVTNKLEDKIEGLDNIKEITSDSSLGLSTIIVEFIAEADLDKSIRNLKDAVDLAKLDLPEEAEDPYVAEMNINDSPILRLSLSGDMSEADLQRWADRVARELETLPEILEVAISGRRELEWQINIDPDKLKFYQIPFNQLTTAIRGNNINLPAGNLDIDERLYNIRVNQKIVHLQDLKSLPIASLGEGFIYLEDVAEIKAELSQARSKSFLFTPDLSLGSDSGQASIDELSAADLKPKLALTLNVKKRPGSNIIKAVAAGQAHFQELKQKGAVPESLTAEVVWDESVFIRDNLSTLQNSAIQTIILILIILFLVLNIRAALITSLIIPLSFFASFGILHWLDISLNHMVLFSLVLSLGLLVDTAIVIMEGMFEGLRTGLNSVQAAYHSIKTFKWSVISGVATTIAAFVPMLLVSGIMGQYLRIIPITVSVVLGSALFWSLTILPTLGAKYFTRHNGGERSNKQLAKIRKLRQAVLEKLQQKYRQIMNSILRERAKRWLVLVAAWITLIIVGLFPLVGILKVGFFPKVDLDSIFINVKAPRGTTLLGTEKLTRQVEAELIDLPELKNFVTTLGSGISISGLGSSSGEHLAYIAVRLSDDRERKSFEIIDDLRPRFKKITQAEVVIEDISSGPPQGAPIEASLTGPGLEQLKEIAVDIKGFLGEIPGTVDITTDTEPGLPEFVFSLKKEKLSYYGLSAMQVAGFLRTIIYGNTISSVTVEARDVDIVLKTNQETAQSIDQIKRTDILTSKGPVALGSLAEIEFKPSLNKVSHKDGQRVVRVRSFLEKKASASEVNKALQKKLRDYPLDSGYTISMGGELEEFSKSFMELYISMSVAVFLIFMILILQFNSVRQTVLILSSLPLALIGVFIGLTLLRLSLNFPAFVGIVGLAGIAVNDAIILVSQVNANLYVKGNPQLGLKSKDVLADIIEAGSLRVQPIFLTTITTILGLLPVTFSDEVWRSLGFAIIFGLLFATVLTLIIIPVMYVSWQGKKLGLRELKIKNSNNKHASSAVR